ncbi:hypothetical protein EVAR_41473_1 [Eumeta japonica]|uniref:Uncharacterized protein n=1 Tax=Eumeta variegata TaxID=151549 RepID=A0A4C1X3G9_EUMVA|nr:hypothetical protein EVAR_41473_1 [Eumeta japonica]
MRRAPSAADRFWKELCFVPTPSSVSSRRGAAVADSNVVYKSRAWGSSLGYKLLIVDVYAFTRARLCFSIKLVDYDRTVVSVVDETASPAPIAPSR